MKSTPPRTSAIARVNERIKADLAVENAKAAAEHARLLEVARANAEQVMSYSPLTPDEEVAEFNARLATENAVRVKGEGQVITAPVFADCPADDAARLDWKEILGDEG